MGKPTGFLEYKRVNAGHRAIQERIQDFNEFVIAQPYESLHQQSARCMDCGVAFCHTGRIVDGASIGCPLSNLIPEVNDLVYRNEIEKAYHRLSKTHPFPEFTSRVCPALCEGSCTLGEHEEPVSIKEIERLIVDEMLAKGKIEPRIPSARTGRNVAVVGSGPSGLACADMLNRLGNTVTVFERADRPGGILMYGIPNMKLDKQLILNRVTIMQEEGIQFNLSTEVGLDYPILSLVRDFDAIVLCAGSTAERTLDVPGKDIFGVMTALNFLTRSTKNLLDKKPIDGLPDIKGKNVIVVGGGDTGTDCVGTAIRRGAKSVKQYEIMPELPAERTSGNPWPLWPRVRKTDYGQHEAIELFGEDPREYETTVKEIVGDGRKVTAVRTVKVRWENDNGRMFPVDIPGSMKERPADIVLTAMGFVGPERTLIDQLNLETNARGNIATEENGHKSNLLTVFTAGDMRRGPSLVVWAIFEGRRAALECHNYLNTR
ncbi:MAG: glutamate synthase subunit beta [Clostridiales Family XIII bacterium]|jgi:glutamate synthase (NADPH/NADH) small chain|nr:glutamate synthase subunit beta [Clostridiales Family XIII bacterium]